MSLELVWLLLGLVLVVVEMMTGTFYLLILGIAAFIASAVAYSGGEFWLQALVAAGAAIGGSIVVRRRKRAAAPVDSSAIDVGQTAVMEEWVSEPQRLARVRYRGTLWDAEVQGGLTLVKGDLLFIAGTEGNRLKVSGSRPV
jgi:membrane protein implicated in regulation of membrane protease activity